jgi:hypothetical protein
MWWRKIRAKTQIILIQTQHMVLDTEKEGEVEDAPAGYAA